MKKVFALGLIMSFGLIYASPALAEIRYSTRNDEVYDIVEEQTIPVKKSTSECDQLKAEYSKQPEQAAIAYKSCMAQYKMMDEWYNFNSRDLNDKTRYVPVYVITNYVNGTSYDISYVLKPTPKTLGGYTRRGPDQGSVALKTNIEILKNTLKNKYPNIIIIN